jgi:hypothetical protein
MAESYLLINHNWIKYSGKVMLKIHLTIFIAIILNFSLGFGLASAQTTDSIILKASDINFNDYFLYKTIPLTMAQFNFDGKAELWLDKRLAKRKDPSSRYGENVIDATAPEETDFQMAVLKISKKNGKETERKVLNKAFSDLRQESLYENDKKVIVVEEDFTNDFGTYSGPLSSFYNVEEGRLIPLKVKNLITGKWSPMTFFNTGKANWRLVPSKSGEGKDFLQASCYFDSDHPDGKHFLIDYIRVYFDGKEWVSKMKTAGGFYEPESENDFPNESMFP